MPVDEAARRKALEDAARQLRGAPFAPVQEQSEQQRTVNSLNQALQRAAAIRRAMNAKKDK